MKLIQKYFIAFTLVLFTVGATSQSLTKANPVVTKDYNGTMFSSEKSLVDNLALSDSFSYTDSLYSKPNLASLTSKASYTVFVAPDSFFDDMKDEDRDAFLAMTNESEQKEVLGMFIVPGRIDKRSMKHEIEKRNGEPLYLKTLSGKNLGVKLVRKNLILFDGESQVKIKESDFYHSKGFFHIVEGYFISEEE